MKAAKDSEHDKADTLFHLTSGAAFPGLDNDFDFFDNDDSIEGWVAGLGVERKLRQNVSVGLEGLSYNLDNEDDIFYNGDNDYFHTDDENFWVVRTRLTYHFGDDVYETLLK